MTAGSLASRFFAALLVLAAPIESWALSSGLQGRMREACEKGLKDAPLAFKADVCSCYVKAVEKNYPNIQTENYARIRNDVRRIIPDCFAEAISRRDPAVNSNRGWPKAYRAAVITACRGAATKEGAPSETVDSYCDCTAREIEKRFPDSLAAEKYSRHLLAGVPTATDLTASEDVTSICLGQVPDNEEVASVEYQVIRNMRKGMTRANAARNVLRGFSGYYLMLMEVRAEEGGPPANSEVERTKGLVAEAGRVYVEACSKCAEASACERDRVEAMMPRSADRQSPCGNAKAVGEAPPPPMSSKEREALEKDATPLVASMARGLLMGLVSSHGEGTAVSEKDIREAEQSYLQLCERCTVREACVADVDLILAGRAPDKRPWSRATTERATTRIGPSGLEQIKEHAPRAVLQRCNREADRQNPYMELECLIHEIDRLRAPGSRPSAEETAWVESLR